MVCCMFGKEDVVGWFVENGWVWLVVGFFYEKVG